MLLAGRNKQTTEPEPEHHSEKKQDTNVEHEKEGFFSKLKKSIFGYD